ncbi:hypothetical protein ANCCEY_14741 [Ancylostoma ceylanicum]|uniref:Mesencephalic astrocyte-derived neurotrophic factor homolog n=2 Tax=Ancylostoma ceylanicum TaxID=53326 RepID=A0A0D6L511_9BILA|nr:hypothetical protein ANCCEY_14741 [Ancylostoma ceylanicum]
MSCRFVLLIAAIYFDNPGFGMLAGFAALLLIAGSALAQQKPCEVCVKVLTDAMAKVPEAEKSKPDSITKVIREHCKDTRNKDHKFCFYIGALPESATSIMVDVSKPLSWSMPPEKVCEKLKAKDAQICELKYGRFSYS